jgi:ubiquinone/menaquinone biosynthesis C-methylase UbiE
MTDQAPAAEAAHVPPAHDPGQDDAPATELAGYDLAYRDVFWQGREYEDLCDRAAIRALLPPSGDRLIEVGSGFGRLAGEYAGYGSVVLLDPSEPLLQAARERLGADPRFEFVPGAATRLPFPDATFDAVVSFETVEHIAAQETFLDEIRRVLRPGGLVVLSCPNKVEYTDERGVTNEFHVRELYRDELAVLIAPRFPHSAWYGQRPGFYSVVWAERRPARGEIFEIGETTADTPSPGHARPLYFIVVASVAAEALAGVAPVVSVLADRDEWVYRDYEKVTRSLDAAHRRGNALAEQVSELHGHYADAVRQRDAVQAQVGSHAAATAERAELTAKLAAQQEEITRRASFRWWLALPLRRVWLAITGRPPST